MNRKNITIFLSISIIVVSALTARSLPPTNTDKIDPSPTPSPTATPLPSSPPPAVYLGSRNHTFQTFNNCGPASLSMALAHYGINVSQTELGNILRPYQIPNGDNDDKSVTLRELAVHAEGYGLVAYHRPGGTIELVKRFLSAGYPVITRTLTRQGEDIGHFRVVTGYDESAGVLIQDDSLQGANLRYPYQEFLTLWQHFNYEYLVLLPDGEEPFAESVLGEQIDELTAWQFAAERARQNLAANPPNVTSRFNLSIAHYHLGEYEQAIQEYEQVASRLPARTLWYQLEPVLAYFELGDYERVFMLTSQIIENGNRAYSELYLLRAQIYEKQGNPELAKREFELAAKYNNPL